MKEKGFPQPQDVTFSDVRVSDLSWVRTCRSFVNKNFSQLQGVTFLEVRVLDTSWTHQDKFWPMRLRSFQATGCHICTTGKNDALVEVKGIDGPLDLPGPGTPFNDEEYIKQNWGGHNVWNNPMGPDSDSSEEDGASSSGGSSSDSSSEAAED